MSTNQIIMMSKTAEQTNAILNQIKDMPTTMVEVNINQSILSSNLISMDKSTIEMVVNTLIHTIKNVFDVSFYDINCLAYRIDTLQDDFFSYDVIEHRLILFGIGFEKKLPLLKESVKSFVRSKMGDLCSMIILENQESSQIFTYLKKQGENTTHRGEFVSDKMLKFYHPDLYSISEKGWHIFNPKELQSSFVVFE